MNWHLFLDVWAWVWGIIIAAIGLIALFDDDSLTPRAICLLTLTTLCWAWVIAG